MSVKRYDKNYKIEVVRRAISKDKAVPDLLRNLASMRILYTNGWENSKKTKQMLFQGVGN